MARDKTQHKKSPAFWVVVTMDTIRNDSFLSAVWPISKTKRVCKKISTRYVALRVWEEESKGKGVWTPVILSALIHTCSARRIHAPYCSRQCSESSDPHIGKQARLATSIRYLENVMNKKCSCVGEFQSRFFFFFFNLSEYDDELLNEGTHKYKSLYTHTTIILFPKTRHTSTYTARQRHSRACTWITM